jgi:hypothetical protein
MTKKNGNTARWAVNTEWGERDILEGKEGTHTIKWPIVSGGWGKEMAGTWEVI